MDIGLAVRALDDYIKGLTDGSDKFVSILLDPAGYSLINQGTHASRKFRLLCSKFGVVKTLVGSTEKRTGHARGQT